MSKEEQQAQARHIRAILDGKAVEGDKFTITIAVSPAGGFFATSEDLRGLLVFEATIDKLAIHTFAAIEGLVDMVLSDSKGDK